MVMPGPTGRRQGDGAKRHATRRHVLWRLKPDVIQIMTEHHCGHLTAHYQLHGLRGAVEWLWVAPASCWGQPGSILGQFMWDRWWTNLHWDRCLSQYFCLPLSNVPPMLYNRLHLRVALTRRTKRHNLGTLLFCSVCVCVCVGFVTCVFVWVFW
jgi:hypothetical protein